MVNDQIENVYMFDPEARLGLGQVVEQELDVLADAQFILGGIIENVEPDFVAQAAAAQQLVGDELGQDAVQTLCELVAHVPTVMQRRT